MGFVQVENKAFLTDVKAAIFVFLEVYSFGK